MGSITVIFPVENSVITVCLIESNTLKHNIHVCFRIHVHG